ncbi:MAG: LptF/LptG family permease, partial [Leptospiraceae bacterium]|nr:LptF/LptG family permease [Leptospiraceae bacterium]
MLLRFRRQPMDILDRYIFRKFLAVFTTTLVLLFGLGTIVKILDSLRDFEQNKHGTMLLVKYYATVMPAYVPYIVPPSLVFAIAFTISHFNRNFEISVILAAGRSFRRILRPMLIFAIILACAFFL